MKEEEEEEEEEENTIYAVFVNRSHKKTELKRE